MPNCSWWIWREEPRALAEIDEIAWVDPAAPGDIELAPLTRRAVLGLLRS